MKAPNISPAPWEVHGSGAEKTHYIHAANRIVDIVKPSGFYRAPTETEANAKAIAAVPQLLNALARLESAVSNHQLAGITIASLDELCDAQDQAREALRAAGYTD